MLHRLALILAVAGCGRIGFDPGAAVPGDAAAPGDAVDAPAVIDPACNTPIAVGSISDLVPSADGDRWLAAAAVPTGIVVGFTAAGGVHGVIIDLTGSAPTLRPELTLPGVPGSNLDVSVTSNAVLFSTLRASSDGIALWITDLSLGSGSVITADNPVADIEAPDHAVGRPGGGFAVVGGITDTAIAYKLDNAGNVEGTARTFALVGARGGSITALPGGGYAAVWDKFSGAACLLLSLDDQLMEVARTTIPSSCKFARVAPTAGGTRIAASWSTPGMAATTTFDRALTSSANIAQIGASVSSTRIAATPSFAAALVPVTTTDAEVQLFDGTGAQLGRATLAPYNNATTGFQIDLVGRGDALYAVWADKAAAPTLYLEHLCP